MTRLRKGNGQFRSTTLADFGHHACSACGRFYPLPEPKPGPGGFIDPVAATKPGPCPHCDHDPDQPAD